MTRALFLLAILSSSASAQAGFPPRDRPSVWLSILAVVVALVIVWGSRGRRR